MITELSRFIVQVVISRSDDDNVAVAPPAVRPSSATNESSTPEMELQEGGSLAILVSTIVTVFFEGVVTDQRAKIAGEIRDTEEHFVFVMDLLEKHYHSSLQVIDRCWLIRSRENACCG